MSLFVRSMLQAGAKEAAPVASGGWLCVHELSCWVLHWLLSVQCLLRGGKQLYIIWSCRLPVGSVPSIISPPAFG